MKQRYALIFTFLLFSTSLLAQEADRALPADSTRNWKFIGKGDLNYSQVGLKNWAAGGQNSLAILGLVNMQANYKDNRYTWDNQLDVGYGLQRIGTKEAPFRKSDDRLIFLSKVSRSEMVGKLALTALVDFRTQFTPGYKYFQDTVSDTEQRVYISNFMAPGYLTTALGLEYKPNDNFFVLFSPVTGKYTFVLDDTLSAQGAYGVEPGEKMRTEFGAYLNTRYQVQLMKNVTFQTRLNLFSNYKRPTTIDVNWENLLSLKVNEYISASINTQLIYDEDVKVLRSDGTTGAAVQFKHALAAGLSYQFK